MPVIFHDKLPEGAPFSGTTIIPGLKPTPAMIARSKRRAEIARELKASHPDLPFEAIMKLTAERAAKEEAAGKREKPQ